MINILLFTRNPNLILRTHDIKLRRRVFLVIYLFFKLYHLFYRKIENDHYEVTTSHFMLYLNLSILYNFYQNTKYFKHYRAGVSNIFGQRAELAKQEEG